MSLATPSDGPRSDAGRVPGIVPLPIAVHEAPAEDGAEEPDGLALELPPQPYPGLRPFDASEWLIFFGPERMQDEIISRLIRQRLVMLHGDSGAGKSSLIRAGVLPRLVQEQARGGVRWRTCTAMPGRRPLSELAARLAELDGRGGDADHRLSVRRALNQGARAPQALAQLLLGGEDDHLCILIDQFEELFDAARDPQLASEARGLTDALVAFAKSPPRGLYVILTMRSEFLGACARFPGFAETVNEHQYLMPPMELPDLLRAIREPASLYDGEVELALAQRLAADALVPDGLPLVQHALMVMYRDLPPRAPGERWRLGAACYPDGGVAAMLSRHAVEVHSRVSAAFPAFPRLVQDMFRALSSISADNRAIRRRIPLERLARETGVDTFTMARVVEPFRADGVSFLKPRGPERLDPDVDIDIGHEALIRQWSLMADPKEGWVVREFRDGLVWRSLVVQAESWERDRRSVLSPATTEERMRWMAHRNAVWAERYGGEWEKVAHLLQASDRARKKAKFFRWFAAAAISVFAVVVVTLWFRLTVNRHAMEAQAQLAMASAAAAQDRSRAADLFTQKQVLLGQNNQLQDNVAASFNFDQMQYVLGKALKGSDADLRRAVEQAVGVVQPAATPASSSASAAGAARIYLHISGEEQRAAANLLRPQLARLKPGGVDVVAPGVQLVSKQGATATLRCFRQAECRDDAPEVLREVNELIVSPKLKLEDLSGLYDKSTAIRWRHYEIWFGPAPLVLATPSQAPVATPEPVSRRALVAPRAPAMRPATGIAVRGAGNGS